MIGELVRLFEGSPDMFHVKHTALAKPSKKIQAIIRGRFRKQLQAVLKAKELKLLKEADRKLSHQVKSAIGADVASVPVTGKEINAFNAALGVAVVAGSHSAAAKFRMAPTSGESFVSEYLKDGGFQRISAAIDKTSVDLLSSAVANTYESGGSYEEVVSAIRGKFGEFSTYRAEMIAQTELNDAYAQGVLEFGRQTGALGKSWEPDGEACPICLDNADQGTIPIDDDFASGDDAPPAHPNCDCSLDVHAGEGEGE
jgi:SPP1 gp7 family putative phage head morphogenesis protein